MGTITLVRHGQASFGAADYDQLSALGVEQTRLLGEWQQRCKLPLTHVMMGPARRHAQSAEHFQRGAGSTQTPLLINELNEFDHEEVLYRLRPEFADKAVLAAYLASTANPRRSYQLLFEQAVQRWLSGAHDAEYRESWKAFQQRCSQGLQRILTAAGPSQDVWVFTSGGPITAICQTLLNIADADIFTLNWALVNAGVTRLLYSGERVSLSTFNTYAHLEQWGQPQLITYR